MLTVVKQHLRLLGRYFSFNLQSAMEYRVNFLIQSFGMVLNNMAFIFFWWVIFHQLNNQVGGYSFQQMMSVWAIGSAGFGVSQILFGNSMRLTRLIVDGQLDTYMLQPKNILWNILISRTSIPAWGDLLFGMILFFVVGPRSWYHWSIFLFAVLLAGCLLTAVMVVANTFTFYLGRVTSLGGLIPEFVLTFSIYPESIFQGVTRFLLYTILPAGFISYIPVRLLQNFSWVQFGYLLAFDVGFVGLMFWFFYRGLKRYESGNLMQSRV